MPAKDKKDRNAAARLEIVYKKPSELLPADYNPRHITRSQFFHLQKSIERFGFQQPVIVNATNKNTIVGGHQRVAVAEKMGLAEIPCVMVNLTPEEERELNIRLNANTGEWDYDKLANSFDLSELESWGFDVRLLGLEDGNIKGKKDPDDAPDPSKVPSVTQLGDVWMLGQHRLICGDATDSTAYAKVLEGRKAKMMFTDPPYNVDYEGSAGKIKNDKMSASDFHKFLDRFFDAALERLDGACYVCMSSSELHTLIDTFRKNGGHWSTYICWAKNSFTLGRSDYHRQYEPIMYGWPDGSKKHFTDRRDLGDVWKEKGFAVETNDDSTYTVSYHDEKYDRQITIRVNDLNDIEIDKQPFADIWYHDKPKKSKLHPTMKPVELVLRAINNSSQRGDTVLDPFSGSGSTLIACEQSNRVYAGIELDPKFCDVIVTRWQEFTGQTATRVPAAQAKEKKL